MGQKAYTITLKPTYNSLNLQTHSTKNFLIGNSFINFFKALLLKKNIILSNFVINFIGNILSITLILFFKTAKLFYYQKKNFKKIKFVKLKKISNLRLSQFLFKNLQVLKTNVLVLSVSILNHEFIKSFNKILLKFFYKKTKSFLYILFQRRFTLFFDFLKQMVLLTYGLISGKVFLQTLSQLFKYLHKKIHTRFFVFFNLISHLILNYQSKRLLLSHLQIKGIKFLVKGKLQGKMRASSKILQEGKIPVQSFNAKMDIAKQHVCTLYGVFGLKLWIYRI